MSTALPRWDFDDTTVWLRPVDLFLALTLMKAGTPAGASPSCLEIGVWKGGWLVQAVDAVPDATGVGIDPYPGSPTLRQEVLDRAAGRGLADRVTLVSTPTDACAQHCPGDQAHREYSVVHIDGLHVETQVTDDLHYAMSHCGELGTIIVDDYLHPAYPGIASAMYQFLAQQQYAMFLATRNKAYLCPRAVHERRSTELQRALDGAGLTWERYNGERSSVRYLQSPDVMGRPVTLCLDPANDERLLAGLDRPLRMTLRQNVSRWVPPGALDGLRTVRRRIRNRAAAH